MGTLGRVWIIALGLSACGPSSGMPGVVQTDPAREAEVLGLVNQARSAAARCGDRMFAAVAPLTLHPQLANSARVHSVDMATRDYFEHDTPEGVTPTQRMVAAGYTALPNAENIAGGSPSATTTVAQWMASPGHCASIMNGELRSLGVGYAFRTDTRLRHYWTLNFGAR